MMTMPTTSETRGQAAVEVAIGILIFALLVSAFVFFTEVFLGDFRMMHDVRKSAGEAALNARDGEQSASRKEEYTLELGDSITEELHLSEKVSFPACRR